MPNTAPSAPFYALLMALSLSGCAAASEFAIEQSLSEILATKCDFKALLYGKPFCAPVPQESETTAENTVYCTQTLGEMDCYHQPIHDKKLDMTPASGPGTPKVTKHE